MQTKKEELRQQILNAAEREFLAHGYQNGSMRNIARRSHTTIGNIYHYFSNKEALLDAIIGDLPEQLEILLDIHQNYDVSSIDFTLSFEEIVSQHLPNLFPIDQLLSPRFLILMKQCDGTKYQTKKEQLISQFGDHLLWHLGMTEKSLLTNAILETFLSALLYIGTNMKNLEEGRLYLAQYIKIMSFGFFPVSEEERP